MTEKRCPEYLPGERLLGGHICNRPAVTEAGFCKIHDPVAKEERRKKRGPTHFEIAVEGMHRRHNYVVGLEQRIAELESINKELVEACESFVAEKADAVFCSDRLQYAVRKAEYALAKADKQEGGETMSGSVHLCWNCNQNTFSGESCTHCGAPEEPRTEEEIEHAQQSTNQQDH